MKPSWQIYLIRLIGLLIVKPAFTKGLKPNKVRSGDIHGVPKKYSKSLTITEHKSGSSRYYEVLPPEVKYDATIVYCHGGAYVGGFKDYAWSIAAKLATRLSCKVVMPDYRLTPEFTVNEAMTDARFAVESVRKENPSKLILMGDSAGAGLTMATALNMKAKSESPADALILLSPWLDVRLNNPSIDQDLQRRDRILAIPGLQDAGIAYAGDLGVDHPYVSPIDADLSGLPPMLLQIGTDDIFYPDCGLFKERAEQAGVDIEYQVAEHMPHVWMMMAPILPEADAAVDEIEQFIHQRIR